MCLFVSFDPDICLCRLQGAMPLWEGRSIPRLLWRVLVVKYANDYLGNRLRIRHIRAGLFKARLR